MREPLEVRPVAGIGRIQPGDDLAGIIAAAAPWLRDGDVLVVTSKIVSKAEGQLVEVPADGPEREATRERLVIEQTARTVARRGPTHIVATHHGFVMAGAGIDASNVETTQLVLLPKDPDGSARSLRAALAQRHGVNVAVIISDTMGRPWRNGLTDVALGVAGLEPILDHRGQTDPYGNELQITQVAVADELCSAAELVKGKRDEVPVAVIRGYLDDAPTADGPGALSMVRELASDMFSLGTAEARAEGLSAAGRLPYTIALTPEGVDPVQVAQALSGMSTAPSTMIRIDATPAAVTIRCAAAGDAGALVALGIDVHRLRCALAGAGFASALVAAVPEDDGEEPAAEIQAVLAIAVGLPLG